MALSGGVPQTLLVRVATASGDRTSGRRFRKGRIASSCAAELPKLR